MSDDAALVRSAQAGDPAALGELLQRYRALLRAVAVGLLGHGPQAEDAVQDACLIAVRRIGDLRDPSAARPWLLAILGNVCRAQLRRPAQPVLDPLARVHRPVEEEIERLALRDWVWTALDRLSPPLRLAIVLRYFSASNTYEAIADLCGVPVGTVRSRLNAGRAKLAHALLETAADAHPAADAHLQLAVATGAAMAAFERTGDRAPLRDVLARDLRFTLSDGVERRGLDPYAERLARGFERGITGRVLSAVNGSDLAVVELRLQSREPVPCPPAVTQVVFHDGHAVRRIVAHYAALPA